VRDALLALQPGRKQLEGNHQGEHDKKGARDHFCGIAHHLTEQEANQRQNYLRGHDQFALGRRNAIAAQPKRQASHQ
jgi:hypothetical protein